jgi:hypothetical protein
MDGWFWVILVAGLALLVFLPGGPDKASRDRFPDNRRPGAGCHCDYLGPNKEPPA